MATQQEQEEKLRAALAAQTKTTGEIKDLQAQLAGLKAERDALALSNQALAAENAGLKQQVTTLEARIKELEDQIANTPPPASSDATDNLVLLSDQVLAKANENDLLITDGSGVTPPEPPEESDVLAVRLGKSYAEYPHPPGEVFPDQFLRNVIPTPDGAYRAKTNEGLTAPWTKEDADAADYLQGKVWLGGTWVSPDANTPVGTPYWKFASGDFSSSIGQVISKPLVPLVAPDPGHINAGVGVLQLELENMSNNSFSAAPLLISNPDPRAYEWLFNQGIPVNEVGTPIAIARGYGRWSNAGLVLFTGGLAGTASTPTAKIPHGGPILPKPYKPTNIALTSGNEFTCITCIGADGKGYLAVFANWGGKRLQEASGLGSFYHDWPEPYPGLPSPAIYCGFKLLGFVDLGMNFPTSVSAVASQGSDRVNAPDGNAGTLGDKHLETQAGRDEFATGNNSTYISHWGFVVVASRTENKVVYVDLTALFAGYRTQYTTTQELFDATLPKNKGGNWWAEFGTGDTDWPPTFTGKPEWAPRVVATLDVPSPTAVLLCEANNGKLAVASEDGTIFFFKGGPAGSAQVSADGSVTVGRNVTCLTYDKYPSQYGTREGRGFFAISRGDRRIDRVNGWGAGSAVIGTLRDNRLKDPVAGEVFDTHGLDGGGLTVCDMEGQQVLTYRYTELNLVNNGGQTFGMGADGKADWECTGIMGTPEGKPIEVSGTNTN